MIMNVAMQTESWIWHDTLQTKQGSSLDFLQQAKLQHILSFLASSKSAHTQISQIPDIDFSKLTDIHTLFDLILNPPKNYQNKTLLPTLTHNAIGAVRVEITQSTKAGFGKKTYLKILAHCLDFTQTLYMTLFHPKPFMYKNFAEGAQCVVYGKLEQKGAIWTITQPKIIHDFGAITLEFKTTPAKNKILNALCALITHDTLRQCGIIEPYVSAIYEIFHPTQEFVRAFAHHNGYFGVYQEALKFVEIWHHILRLRTKNLHFQASFICNGDAKTFIDSLPFTLTQGQHEAIKSIAKDLSSHTATRRLIMGDVGCGKTIVILSAVMMTYPHKSILMAPTSILAKQLYEEAKKFLPPYIKIQLITAQTKDISHTPKHTQSRLFAQTTHSDTTHDTEMFDADFIIGTQAILYRDFDYTKFALVMSDEQHRFGTNQRHKLEKMFSTTTRTKPHILQFSATPIPRTFAMIQTHYIQHTIIKDLPFKKDIQTSIIGKRDFPKLLVHLHNEFTKGHQAIIIYPLVEESQHIEYLSLSQGQEFWLKHFEGVYVTSGKDKQKEEVLEEFAQKGNLLLATTVVEVGISLPKLSTIIIVAPERLGLATLHQLRGRVSRNGLKGYCFLYTNTKDTARLESFAKTLNGFEIAQLDLKNRNSGDLLSGTKQSGNEFKFFDPSSDEHILSKVNALIDSQTSV